MRVTEVKKALMAIFKKYFVDTPVVWSEQRKLVKPPKSFITLKLSNLKGELHNVELITDDGPIGYQNTQMRLTVQLFTHGGEETVTTEDGTTYTMPVNTVLEDITDMDKFIASEYVLYMCTKYDIAIRKDGFAQDISAVVDNTYEYRAIQEYIVSFTQTSEGMAGIKRTDWAATASGGGTAELAEKEIGYIDKDKIDITEEIN